MRGSFLFIAILFKMAVVLSLHAIPAESVGLPYQAQTCSMVDETNTTLACLYFGKQDITIMDSPYIKNAAISFWGGGGGGGSDPLIITNVNVSPQGLPVYTFIYPLSSGGGGSGGAIVNYPVRPGSVVNILSQGEGGAGVEACGVGEGENGTATCVSFEAGFGMGQTSLCSVCAQGGGGGGTYVGGGVSILGGTCPNIHDIRPAPPSSATAGEGIMPYTHAGSSGACSNETHGGAWNQPCISVVGCFVQTDQPSGGYYDYAFGPAGYGAYAIVSYNGGPPLPYSGAGGQGMGCVSDLPSECLCPGSAAGGDGGLLVVYSFRLVSLLLDPCFFSFQESR